MKYIVGIELPLRGEGPLEWIAWASALGATQRTEVTAMHVVEERGGLPWPPGTRALAERAAIDVLDAAIAGSAAKACIGDVVARASASVDEALADEASLRGATLVIGRRASRRARSWVRLGRTARRVLRRLATPVVVIPPDLRATEVGRGPVVVGLDLGAQTMSAVDHGIAFAAEIGRPLVLAHVLPTPVLPYLGLAEPLPSSSVDLGVELDRRSREALASFLRRQGLTDRTTEVLVGSPIDALLGFAERSGAAMVVCGSRLLGTTARILASASFGSELAGAATMPVTIVPPALEVDTV